MDEEKLIQEAYKAVFNGGTHSVIVLSDILSMLGFFNNVPDTITPECIAVGNTILSRLGCFNGEKGVNSYISAAISASKINTK